jgi:hypothetical protein
VIGAIAERTEKEHADAQAKANLHGGGSFR